MSFLGALLMQQRRERRRREQAKKQEHFAKDADLTVHWPQVRPCWEEPREPEKGSD